MADDSYPGCVRELYESEIFGEAFALRLLEVAKSDRDRYQLGTLLQLETETKARLRPLLQKYAISLSEQMDLGSLDEVVSAYQAIGWREFAAAMKPTAQSYLSRFEEIAAIGPEEDRSILEGMIRHEASILRWLTLESEGPNTSSLDDMIAQLSYPLPSIQAES
jgi:hypothetical protein